MVPQTQNGISSTSCGNEIVSKTVLRMKIHKFRYFPKTETYGKESVVNVKRRVLRMLLQLLFQVFCKSLFMIIPSVTTNKLKQM